MARENNKVSLQDLAAAGRHEELRKVLQAGAYPDSGEGNWATPLHAAAAHGQAEAFEILLAYGAEPDLVDKKGRSAEDLVLKAYRDACDEIGVSPDIKYIDYQKLGKEKAEAWRRRRDTLNGIRDALSANALKKTDPLVGLSDRQGRTRLHWAAWEGDSMIVQQCIGAGVGLQQEDKNEDTPLLLAARAGHTEIVRLLADAWPEGVVHENKKGENAVFCAVLSGDADLLAEVTWRAVEVTKGSAYSRLTVHGETKDKGTPLKQAIKDRNIEMVDILIEHGAWVDDVAHLAMRSGDARICRSVLGANRRMKQSWSPGYHDDDQETNAETYLEYAIEGGTPEVIAIILEMRPDLAEPLVTARNRLQDAREQVREAEESGDKGRTQRAVRILGALEETSHSDTDYPNVQQALRILEASSSGSGAPATEPEPGM